MLTLATWLLTVGGAAAEPSMRWEECVSLATRHNPDLASSRLAWEGAQADYKGTLSSLMPTLTLSHSLSDSDSSAESSWRTSGSLGLDIFDMGNYSSIRSASAARRLAKARFDLESADLRLSLRRAFAELLFTQGQIAVVDRIEAMRRTNAELVSLKYDSGRESKGNMLRAKAELSAARADSASARRALRVARIELNRLLGRDDLAETAVSGTWGDEDTPPSPDDHGVIKDHPRLVSLREGVAQTEAALSSSKSSLWPTLSASVTRSWRDLEYHGEPEWSASGTLSYRLFAGGPTAVYHAVSKAKKNLEKAEEDLRSGRDGLASSLEIAWAALASAVEQVSIRKEYLEAARQRNDEASVRYASGLLSFEIWEGIVTELAQSEKSHIRALRDAMTAKASWDNASGRTLEAP